MGFRDGGSPAFACQITRSFSIPCESWGSATRGGFITAPARRPFSIPCESWGSATGGATWAARRGPVFQYSLRIVGFRDEAKGLQELSERMPFSIPCESWGSATGTEGEPNTHPQTSFSIPCESWGSATHQHRPDTLRAMRPTFSIPCESWGSATRRFPNSMSCRKTLSVFPANRGVPRRVRSVAHFLSGHIFQYSLRIVGFRDDLFRSFLYARRITFSIPCESWGSATRRVRHSADIRGIFQYSLRIVGFRD